MSENLNDPRKKWMATLAKASLAELELYCGRVMEMISLASPCYRFLRSPEVGLAMVRGRAGGTGQAFNLGEMTLTRCVLQLDPSDATVSGGEALDFTGFGYVAGRSQRHAELAALCDALLQHPDWQGAIQAEVIEPLEKARAEKRDREAQAVEATRVNFFTLLRGE
jgi:alpha-D-ribose 1-methylphosphonate 5-triphosphate synthase subunit PhnG